MKPTAADLVKGFLGKYINLDQKENPYVHSIEVDKSTKEPGKYTGGFGGGRSISPVDFNNRDLQFDTEQDALDFYWNVAEKWKNVIKEMYEISKMTAARKGIDINEKLSITELLKK